MFRMAASMSSDVRTFRGEHDDSATDDAVVQAPAPRPPRIRRAPLLLGPAFVAAIAYVDPGNVAANLTAGARYGYLLLWVLVVANAMAVLVQYQSAKLGLVTGESLPGVLGQRMRRGPRLAFWAQAELVAAATDIAEVVGGAIALQLLFGVPLPLGGLIVGVVSLLLLATQNRYGQRRFEHVIVGLLAIITVGFLAGLFVSPPDARGVLSGPGPALRRHRLRAARGLDARRDRHAARDLRALGARPRPTRPRRPAPRSELLRATRWDVGFALAIAGVVNIGLLLLAASGLRGVPGTDSIPGAYDAIVAALGIGIGIAFADRPARVGPRIHLGRRLRGRDDHGGPDPPPDPPARPPRGHPDPRDRPAGRRRRRHLDPRRSRRWSSASASRSRSSPWSP